MSDEGWSKPEDYIEVYQDGLYVVVWLKTEKRQIQMIPSAAEYVARQLQIVLQSMDKKGN